MSMRRSSWFPVAAAVLLGGLVPCGAAGQDSLQIHLVDRSVVDQRMERVTRGNEQRSERLKELFAEAGCDDGRLSEQTVERRPPNVICTLPGAGDAAVIIVGAHFDHTALGLGAVDNWSGAALLPSLFESLQGEPRRHTFVFIGFTDEERGLIGSRAYVAQLSEDEIGQIRLMINLDALGMGPTQVWVSHSDAQHAARINAVAHALRVPLGAINGDQVGDDDSTSFRESGIPTLMLHSSPRRHSRSCTRCETTSNGSNWTIITTPTA